MNKELARDILQLMNTPQHIEAIAKFADALIEKAKMNLEGAPDYETVRHLQGQIAAAKEFKKIRDYAVNFTEK